MSNHVLYLELSYLEIGLGLIVLALLVRARNLKTYWPMLVTALWGAFPFTTLVYVRHLGKTRISPVQAYSLYFYVFWAAFAAQAVCGVLLTYILLSAAMRPLKGLQSLGKIIYFWAAGISVAVAVGAAVDPGLAMARGVIMALSQFQRSTGIITLSLVLFVCFAIRPMGLSPRSRVVGAGLGLGLISVANTLQAQFFFGPRTLYSTYALISTVSTCVADCIWIYYFAVPEPKRKFILLPTTSPFHRWNQISELLGHDPGYVAIGGIPPDAFADAEIQIFHRASEKMSRQEELSAGGEESSAPARRRE